jgi:platelet-activating factor acetylhydrolase
MQARLDGARWQVVPAYLGALSCTAVSFAGRHLRVSIHPLLARLTACVGAAGAASSAAAGLFAPVFTMPKPTGPYRVGKTTRLWIDRSRRSWLLKNKARSISHWFPYDRVGVVNADP